jgi:hypothetical protein
MRIWILTIIVWIMLVAPSGADGGFTQVDRERMIRLEVKFEEIDKRFEQMDKRLVELREDMNNRFEQIMSMSYILSGIFMAMFTAVFGFAWWDRRSILVQAREEALLWMDCHCLAKDCGLGSALLPMCRKVFFWPTPLWRKTSPLVNSPKPLIWNGYGRLHDSLRSLNSLKVAREAITP